MYEDSSFSTFLLSFFIVPVLVGVKLLLHLICLYAIGFEDLIL